MIDSKIGQLMLLLLFSMCLFQCQDETLLLKDTGNLTQVNLRNKGPEKLIRAYLQDIKDEDLEIENLLRKYHPSVFEYKELEQWLTDLFLEERADFIDVDVDSVQIIKVNDPAKYRPTKGLEFLDNLYLVYKGDKHLKTLMIAPDGKISLIIVDKSQSKLVFWI